MARVTVEDCLGRVGNCFELVLMGARRARALSSGEISDLDREGDKDTVVALREIADGVIDTGALREDLIESLRKRVERRDGTSSYQGRSSSPSSVARRPAWIGGEGRKSAMSEDDVLTAFRSLSADARRDGGRGDDVPR